MRLDWEHAYWVFSGLITDVRGPSPVLVVRLLGNLRKRYQAKGLSP